MVAGVAGEVSDHASTIEVVVGKEEERNRGPVPGHHVVEEVVLAAQFHMMGAINVAQVSIFFHILVCTHVLTFDINFLNLFSEWALE